MVWEFGVVSAKLMESTIPAEASFPKIEERKPARTVKGPKNVPDNREKARIELIILNLGFIKQTNYREISSSAPN